MRGLEKLKVEMKQFKVALVEGRKQKMKGET